MVSYSVTETKYWLHIHLYMYSVCTCTCSCKCIHLGMKCMHDTVKRLYFAGCILCGFCELTSTREVCFETKIVSKSSDPFTSVICTHVHPACKWRCTSKCTSKAPSALTPKSKRSSLRLYMYATVGRFLQLFAKCQGWFSKTQDKTVVH